MKQKITVAVVAMVISLSGIIFLQIYWINGAIKVRAKQFDSQVFDAINDVTSRLQLHEAMSVLPKIMPGLDSEQRKSVDSFITKHQQHRHHNNFGIHANRYQKNQAENPFKKDDGKEPEHKPDDNRPMPQPDGPGMIRGPGFANDSMMADSGKRLLAKANIYSRVFRRMLANYIVANRDIHSRVSKKFLDSLLVAEFQQRGIDIPNESAIFNNSDHTLEFISSGADTCLLRKSVYRAALFPDDIQPMPYSLVVYFPGKQSFVLRSIGLVLPGSLLFLLVIIVSCGFTVYMLLKQKKLSEMKNDFINNMTHEFKTPIATISLAVDAIADPRIVDNKEKVTHYARMIKEENNRMNIQVQKVLNAAQMDKEDFKLTMEVFDAQEVIEKLIERFRLQIGERNGKLRWHAEAARHQLYCDEVHFGNIINNLLDNANKYSPNTPDIVVKTYNNGDNLIIEVEDRGMGMSRETLKKIFDKFYRVTSGNLHDSKGFGLGLSYVKAVVTAMKGTIDVKSELRKGSAFIIRLPLHQGNNQK